MAPMGDTGQGQSRSCCHLVEAKRLDGSGRTRADTVSVPGVKPTMVYSLCCDNFG